MFKILQIFSLCCLFQYMLSVLGAVIQCDTCCGSIVLSTVAFLCFNYCGGTLILKGMAVKVLDALVVCLAEVLCFLWVLNSERHCVMLV